MSASPPMFTEAELHQAVQDMLLDGARAFEGRPDLMLSARLAGAYSLGVANILRAISAAYTAGLSAAEIDECLQPLRFGLLRLEADASQALLTRAARQPLAPATSSRRRSRRRTTP